MSHKLIQQTRGPLVDERGYIMPDWGRAFANAVVLDAQGGVARITQPLDVDYENGFLAVDAAGLRRVGLMKKYGYDTKLAYGTTVPFAIAQSDASSIEPIHVFTDRMIFRANGQRALPALPVYANNATAAAGGLVAGDLYRSGGDPDVVCIVH